MSYLISATILLFAVWPAYYILLQYSERYGVNRFLLLLAMVAACALPFVSFSSPVPVVTQTVRGTIDYVSSSTAQVLEAVPNEQSVTVTPSTEQSPASTATFFAAWPTWMLVYGCGVALLLLVMGIRLVVLLSLHLRSRPNGDGSYQLLHPGARPGQAFTFGRKIYFSIDVPDAPDFDHVLAHERVHARQGHSLDILLTELFLCAFWFHPAAWWLRTKTRANLEYLVDRAVLDAGSDRRSYQLALVRQSQTAHGLGLTLPFSEPSLKSRIARMTGMPEYRVIAGLAAVALLFWIGAAVLMINGDITNDFADDPTTDKGEYLAASAGPGDPYFDHYANVLPDQLYGFSLNTHRMLTGNEYLQIRAIVSQFPEARLYLYRQPFDEGYNLELQIGGTVPAVVQPLNETPGETAYMIGIVNRGRPGDFAPVAKEFEPDYSDLIESGEQYPQKSDLSVFVNGVAISLLGKPTVNATFNDQTDNNINLMVNGAAVDLNDWHRFNSINGTSITELAASDWHTVRVEGRKLFPPSDQIKKVLGWNSSGNYSGSSLSANYTGGTYRGWYEDLRWPEGRDEVFYYNSQQVSLDFLLDTDFGPASMIQSAVAYDTPQGRYALQVIDDASVKQQRQDLSTVTGVNFDAPAEIEMYFRRLPTPAEAKAIRNQILSFPNLEFLVYQDCQYDEGSYSFGLSNTRGSTNSFANLSVGDSYDEPLHFQIKRYGTSATVNTIEPGAIPDGAPAQEVFMKVDGMWVTFDFEEEETYHAGNLDPMPGSTSLMCLLMGNRTRRGREIWTAAYYSMDGAFDYIFNAAQEKGMSNRPLTFYINDQPVEIEEFGNYQGGPGAYMQIGAEMGGVANSVVVQIIDPMTRNQH